MFEFEEIKDLKNFEVPRLDYIRCLRELETYRQRI